MNDYAIQRRMRSRGGKGRRVLFFLLVVALLLWLTLSGLRVLFSKTQGLKTIIPVTKSSDPLVRDSLASVVQNDLNGAKGDFAVYIKNLKTGELYVYNEHHVFDSASLYKLWVMGEVFEQVTSGRLTMDTKLKEDVEVLNEKFQIASESAELTEGTIEQTVGDSLERMITISDNYSGLLLAWKLRLSTIASYLTRNGFAESKVGGSGESPVTTASDIGLFFEKLYTGKLADPESTDDMLSLLKRQRLNGKLPKLLPEGTVVAHKTGELDTISHDAGIVYTPMGDYIIVVLSDSSAPLSAVERISALSRDVYAYFMK
ncbi:MAG: serine hydrolase [bacterium]|nr:serine hydrolase [bacterium]